MKETIKELDMWLVERRAETRRTINEMELNDSLSLLDEDTKRTELLKLDLLLLELETSIGLMDGVKLW